VKRRAVPKEIASKIWDILVEHTGLRDDQWDRASFIYHAEGGEWTEYRFQGNLGFGGKVWNNADRWYVTCYREDESPERQEAIEGANAALARLREEISSG